MCSKVHKLSYKINVSVEHDMIERSVQYYTTKMLSGDIMGIVSVCTG